MPPIMSFARFGVSSPTCGWSRVTAAPARDRTSCRAQSLRNLSLASDRFRKLWARHDVRSRAGAAVTLDHPQVGELTLNREKLMIGGTDGQLLAIYHAEPGTSNADKLSLLASYVADAASPVTRSATGAAARSRSHPAPGG